MVRYWLTPSDDPAFETKVADICTTYQEAPARAAQGERTVSTDELTGVQALERLHPDLPLAPGKVQRREFEYKRHGTCSFMLNRDVVSGQVVAPSHGPTRTEDDFLGHIQRLVASDPTATRWHIVLDNLDIHRSASLCRYVAHLMGWAAEELGVKGMIGTSDFLTYYGSQGRHLVFRLRWLGTN